MSFIFSALQDFVEVSVAEYPRDSSEQSFNLTSSSLTYGLVNHEVNEKDKEFYSRYIQLQTNPNALSTATVCQMPNDGIERQIGSHVTTTGGLSQLIIDYPTSFSVIDSAGLFHWLYFIFIYVYVVCFIYYLLI